MTGPRESAASPRPGTLFVVGTPIGNPGDISLRAVEVLRSADFVACEERKDALRLLRHHRIDAPLIEINEHTELEEKDRVIGELKAGKRVALISDCGMPVFADPGTSLIQEALQQDIAIDVVPGPTSLTAAVAISGFDVRRFYFHGFLSPKAAERRRELRALAAWGVPIVLLDAPYRLLPVLEDLLTTFGSSRAACVACNLTLPDQHVHRGTLAEAHAYFTRHPGKREFVIIVDREAGRGRNTGGMAPPRRPRI